MLKFLLGLLCLLSLPSMAQLREITFYEVRPAAQPPVLDGKINESVWQNAQVYSRYYQYGRPNPEESPLKTEFRALYDDRGLYVSIVNFDSQIHMLRQNFHENDSIDLWRDDCAELYFDPEANGIGHTIFTVNSGGIKADRKRLDTAVFLADWNGYGWMTSASVEKDRWTLEIFFPWEDLGCKAKQGDLWKFLHARYAWKPNFIGAASAAGADYRAPERFGYLFFAGHALSSPQKIAEILKGKAAAPGCLSVGKTLIRFLNSEIRVEAADSVLRAARREYLLLLTELKALHAGKIPPAALRAVKICDEMNEKTPVTAYRQLISASEILFRLKWEYLLALNFNLLKGEKAK